MTTRGVPKVGFVGGVAAIVAIIWIVIFMPHFAPSYDVFKMSASPRVLLPTTNIPTCQLSSNNDIDYLNKTILLWNTFSRKSTYGFDLGSEGFSHWKCTECRCTVTKDRSLFSQSDMVIFNLGNSPEIPKRRHPNQIYVMFMFESPLHRRLNPEMHNDIFNVTVTYLEDPRTDIHVPLGKVVPREGGPRAVPQVSMENKTKLVAWVVSNCHPQSQRNRYVDDLSSYVPVDIYGRCGMPFCPKHTKGCFRNLEQTYKFYLAFENSYCKDYVTEKTFGTLQRDLVPVVLGGTEYSKIFPEKSMINVRDFDGPAELATYLRYLDQSDEEYKEYFEWKRHWQVMGVNDFRPKAFCRLCQILHNRNYVYKSNFKVTEYWSASRMCRTGTAERAALNMNKSLLSSRRAA